MEEKIREIIERALTKSIAIHNIEDESLICYIETSVNIKENMIIYFKHKSNRGYNFEFKHYKGIVRRIELHAICDPMYDTETIECYVELIK